MSNKHKGAVLKFKEKEYPVLQQFDIMHLGWETDTKGWIIDDHGNNKIIMTDHGHLYEASRKELEEKIKEYQSILNDSLTALSFIPEVKKTKTNKLK